jgi:hypothetical protein
MAAQQREPIIGFQNNKDHSPPITQVRAMSAYINSVTDRYSGQNGQIKIRGREIRYEDTVRLHVDMAALKKLLKTEDASWVNGKTLLFVGPGTARILKELYNHGGRPASVVFVENSLSIAIAQQYSGQLPSPSCTLVTDISNPSGCDWVVEQLRLGKQHDKNMPTKFDFVVSLHQLWDMDFMQTRSLKCLTTLIKPDGGSLIISYGISTKRQAFLCAPKDWRDTIGKAMTPYFNARGDKARMQCSEHTKDVISLDWTNTTTQRFSAVVPVREIYSDSMKQARETLTLATKMECRRTVLNPVELVFTEPAIELTFDKYNGPEKNDEAIARYLEAQHTAKMREYASEIRNTDDAFRLGVECWPIPMEPVYLFQNKQKEDAV